MSSDHFSPWSAAPGRVGLRLVVAGRRAGQPRRCRSASSTRRASATTRRSSPRPRRRCARCSPGGCGSRWARARRPTSTSPASRGRQGERNARLRECVDVMRALFAGEEVIHDGRVAVDRARLWTLPGAAAAAARRGGQRETARWVGEWADGLATVNQPRAKLERDDRRLPGERRRGQPLVLQVHLSWAPTRGGGAARSPTTSGARTSSPRRSAGTSSTAEAVRRGRRATSRPRTCAARCSSRPTSASTSAWLRELRRARLRRDQPAPRRPGPAPVHRRLRRARAPGPAPHERCKATSDLWWKNAVIYCLDVETFLDSDGDGCGDLRRADRAHRLPRRASA